MKHEMKVTFWKIRRRIMENRFTEWVWINPDAPKNPWGLGLGNYLSYWSRMHVMRELLGD